MATHRRKAFGEGVQGIEADKAATEAKKLGKEHAKPYKVKYKRAELWTQGVLDLVAQGSKAMCERIEHCIEAAAANADGADEDEKLFHEGQRYAEEEQEFIEYNPDEP